MCPITPALSSRLALAQFAFDFFEPLLVGVDEVAAEGVHKA